VPRIREIEMSFTRMSSGVSLNAFVVFGSTGKLNTKFITEDLDLDVGDLVDRKLLRWVKTVVTRFSGTGSDVKSGGFREEPNGWNSVFVAAAVLVGSSDVKDVSPTGSLSSWFKLEAEQEVVTNLDVSGSSTLFEGSPFTASDDSSSPNLGFLLLDAFLTLSLPALFAFRLSSDALLALSDEVLLASLLVGLTALLGEVDVVDVSNESVRGVIPRISKIEMSSTRSVSLRW
jgi:hypothetical protein